MKSTGRALSFLLLTMAAVSSGRHAREYFQQAAFQHSPARPEDAFVFFTSIAPPLICELEKGGAWVGGDRDITDLILDVAGSRPYYTCSFEGNETTLTNMNLIQRSLPKVFITIGNRKLKFSQSELYCVADSQLPDEYFQLRVQRPDEEHPMNCRLNSLDNRLYLRFPGYPTIICILFYHFQDVYNFNLSGIVGDGFKCAFQVYSDLHIREKHTEERLYQSLISNLPSRLEDSPHVVCSHHTNSDRMFHFQVRLPGETIYDCTLSDT